MKSVKERLQQTKESNIQIIPKINQIDSYLRRNPHIVDPLPGLRLYKNKSKNIKVTKYAYCTIMFMSESYTPSVLALGSSLGQNNCKYNKICIVQDKSYKKDNGDIINGISYKTIKDLLKVYDFVYGCDLLWIDNYQPPQNHFTSRKFYENIKYYVTKVNILALHQYSKILYLDGSTYANKNLDSIFNQFSKSSFVNDQEFEESNMGIKGGFFLYEPKIEYFRKSIFLIKNYMNIFQNLYFCRGVDEVVLFYSIYPNWSDKKIQRSFACDGNTINKNKQCSLTYFQMYKPFRPINHFNQNLIKRIYQNYSDWDNIVNNLIQLNPNLKIYFDPIQQFRQIFK